jgi:hypothetical protein
LVEFRYVVDADDVVADGSAAGLLLRNVHFRERFFLPSARIEFLLPHDAVD